MKQVQQGSTSFFRSWNAGDHHTRRRDARGILWVEFSAKIHPVSHGVRSSDRAALGMW